MKLIELNTMTTSDLVDLFSKIGLAQDKALLGGQYTKFNRLFDQMAAVSNELKRRDGDQRRALLKLYSFPNIHVQMKAASHTLALAPIEARAKLQAIADSNWFPQAGHAGMTLSNLDNGIYRPT